MRIGGFQKAVAWVLAAVAVVVGLLLLLPAPPVRPNVLLVTIDTLRADHLGCYGYDRPTSPFLDALAIEGVLFERAYTPIPTTAPAHASLLTAHDPAETGVVKNGVRLDAEMSTLAEVLHAEGYQTGGVVSSFVLDERFGWDQGFEAFESEFEPSTSTIHRLELDGFTPGNGFDQRADVTTAEAVFWLRSIDRGRPFFLWVHYFDPHAPYVPPDEFAALLPPRGQTRDAARRAAYDAEIRFMDAEVGRLLADLSVRGLADDTLVVVVGDHGEGLGDHGFVGHGVQLYEEAVRVPLILRFPGRVDAGARLERPVRMIDVMPTILELSGVRLAVAARSGASLAAELEGRVTSTGDLPIFLQRRPHEQSPRSGFDVRGDLAAIVLGDWKYIEAPGKGNQELYDLSSDPGETRNLVEEQRGLAAELRAELRRWDERIDIEGHVTVEEDEALRALGYVQ